MEDEPMEEDLDVESDVEDESDEEASSPALSAASTPPYSEEGFFPPANKSGKLLSARRGRGRPKNLDRKPVGVKLKRWRNGGYGRGENPSRSPRTPTGDFCPPWNNKSPAQSPIHTTGDGEGDKIEKAFPMSAPDDPPVFTEAWPGKLCALCGLSERSMLGQREMIRLSCPDGFPTRPLGVCQSGDKSPRGALIVAPSQRRQRREGKTVAELLDELSLVGYVDDPDLPSIVEPTGTFYVHLGCITWATGITRAPDGDQQIEGAWEVVESALTRRCSFCSRLGAATACKYSGINETCGLYFHFPCAVASAGLLEPQTRVLICSQHLDQINLPITDSIQCVTCFSIGNIANFVMCSTCESHHHGSCVGLSLQPSVRAGWQCLDCRTCQVCRLPSEIGKVMVCETCDKSYHPSCLRPIVTSIPKYGWKCKCCRVCSDCGSRTPGSGLSSRWHNHFSVCDSCYQQRNKGFCCPICGRAYRASANREMVKCSKCCKFVHGACDGDADLATYSARKEAMPEYEYVCATCKVSGRPFSKRKDSIDDGLDPYGPDFYDDLDFDRSPSDKTEGGTGMGKGKYFSLAKKRLGMSRPKLNYHKMKVAELSKKRGIKSKMRGVFGVPGLGLQRPMAEPGSKGDDDPGIENRMVLCSGSDKFVTSQDMCVMCGALGTDQEGCLMACVQCGQCYHPYCVNVKVSKVILTKGWRCLDCTVCEGCGQRNDDARLTLCDDCDISYHIYCMDPPLDTVPRGVWKCKWCVVCVRCGAHEAGTNCSWMNKYTECGPCASHTTCPLCSDPYNENELVIQCETCSRWLHGACDNIKNENDAEKCAAAGYVCLLCRPRDMPPAHLVTHTVPQDQPSPYDLEGARPSQSQFFMDGVCLSEAGMAQIKSMALEQQITQRKKPRSKRFNNFGPIPIPAPPGGFPPPTCEKEARLFATIESVVSAAGNDNGEFEFDDGLPKEEIYREGMEIPRGEDGKIPEPPDGFTIYTTESGALILRRKRTRNLQKVGIGGFLVRVRTVRKEEEPDGEKTSENTLSIMDKPRRKPIRRKPRSKLAESYPSYLQEAFFGRELLDTPKEKNPDSSSDSERDDSLKVTDDKTIELSMDELKAMEVLKAKQLKEQELKMEPSSPLKDEDEGSDSEVLKDFNLKDLPLPSDLLDNDLVDTIMAEEGIKEATSDENNIENNTMSGPTKDELSDILSPHFNLENMVRDSGLPDMDGRDVEEIFKGVLTDDSRPGPNVEMTVQTAMPTSSILPPSFPPPSPYHSEYSNSPHSQVSEPPSPWLDEPPMSVEPSTPTSQRSTPQKMEADEALGLQATISSVLYANSNHPEWKTQFPAWSERYKQILKKWRTLSNDQKAPYLQSARDNRSAFRMKKAQQIPKESPTTSTPPLPPLKTVSVGSGPDGAAMAAPAAEVCEEAAPALDQLTPSTNQPSPDPDPDDRIQVESGSQTDELGLKGQVRVLLAQPRPQNILLRNLVIANNVNVLPPRGLLHLDLTQRAPNVTIRAFEAGGLARLHRPMTLTLHSPAHAAPVHPPTPVRDEPVSTDSAHEPQDHHIRVLTPSEIMRTLPSLDHTHMDQEKTMQQQKNSRESEQERQWKQLQALRQAQQQQQQQVIHDQRVQAMARINRQMDDGNVNLTSQLQVATNQDSSGMGPIASPSPGGRPQFPQNSSVKVTRIHPGQSPSPFAQPMMPRVMRPQLNSPMQSPMPSPLQSALPEQFSPDDSFNPRVSTPRNPQQFPPRQEAFETNPEVARLRDLLQRQGEGNSTPRPWMANQTNYNDGGFTESREGPFRQPLPPGNIARPRAPGQQQMIVRTHPVRQLHDPRLPNVQDQRIRLLLQQQQQQQQQQQVQQQRALLQTRNPLDPYDDIVQRTGVSPNIPGVRLRAPVPQTEQQEIPEIVTAELEQLEQEVGPMAEAEAVSAILGDLGDDDDELLAEMGPDFNLLDYVDTDAGTGDKTNLLDNLDLDDENKKHASQPKMNECGQTQSMEMGNMGVQAVDNNMMMVPPVNPPQSATPPNYAQNVQRVMPINPLAVDGARMPMRLPGTTRVIVGPGGQQIIQQPMQPNLSMPAQTRLGGMSVAPPPPYPGPPPPYPGPQSANMAQMSVGRFGPTGPQYPGPIQDPLHRRPLLLQDQPLLLEELLEQEKREQEKQQHGPGEVDSESQHQTSVMPPMSPMQQMPVSVALCNDNEGIVRTAFPRPPGPFYRPQVAQQQQQPVAPPPPRTPTFNIPATPPPPIPPDVIVSEQDRQTAATYETWLNHQNQLLQQQLKYYETEVQKLRKIRKSLNSKQRQQRKNGNELNETDAMELQRVTTEQSALQKHLDASRKSCRQHGGLIQEYQNKQQKSRPQGSPLSPLHPSHSPHHSMAGSSGVGFGTSPHPNTPQSPMLSPSPSPLHSPGPGINQMPLQQSPISPHSRQPSPRMATPHSQVGDDNPFSPGPLPSPQPTGAGTARMTSPRLVASPGLPDPGRLHAMTMGPRFVRTPASVSSGTYQGPVTQRLVYAPKPGTQQVIQRNILLQQQQRTQQIFQQISQQHPNMTVEQKQKLLQQISQQQSQLEQKQQLIQQLPQQNQNIQTHQGLSNEQKQQIMQQISQQNPNMTMEQKQQLMQQIIIQNSNSQQQQQQQQQQTHITMSNEQKQQVLQQISQQNPNLTMEQKHKLLQQIAQQQHQQQLAQQQQQQQQHQQQIAQQQQQQQQMQSIEQKQTIVQQNVTHNVHQGMSNEQKQQLIQHISQQNPNMTLEQKQQLLQQLAQRENAHQLQQNQQKLQQMQQRQQQLQQQQQQLLDQQMLQQQQQLAAQNRLLGQPRTPEQEVGGPGSVGSIGPAPSPAPSPGGMMNPRSVPIPSPAPSPSGSSRMGPMPSPGQSPGGNGMYRNSNLQSPTPSPGGGGGGGGGPNAPIPRPPCILPGLRGGAPMWPYGKGKRPKRPEDEPSTSRQVSVLRQRGDSFVNLVQLNSHQQPQQQQMIIQLGQNQSDSASKKTSLVCVDYDSMDETPPVSPKPENVPKEDDKPEEIRIATDAEGMELLGQENLLNLELEAEDEPEDRRVIIIDNSPESEKSGVMEFVDEDLMVYEPIEDGEELVVLEECEVLEAHEIDISNCDVMEIESMEEEEDQTPTPPATQSQAESSASKQQIIVRHTKKGKQIVMVKRGEEGKDQRHVMYSTEKEGDDKSENKKESAGGAAAMKEPTTPATVETSPITSSNNAVSPTPKVPVPTVPSRSTTPTSNQSVPQVRPFNQISSTVLSEPNSRSSTPTQPALPTRPTSAPVRTIPSPTLVPPRIVGSPILTRLVSAPLPTRTVPSAANTPPPSRMINSPIITTSGLRLVNIAKPRPSIAPVRLVTTSGITTSNLRLVTSTPTSLPARLPTAIQNPPPPPLAPSPHVTPPVVRFINTPTRLVTTPPKPPTPKPTISVSTTSPKQVVVTSSTSQSIRPSQPKQTPSIYNIIAAVPQTPTTPPIPVAAVTVSHTSTTSPVSVSTAVAAVSNVIATVATTASTVNPPIVQPITVAAIEPAKLPPTSDLLFQTEAKLPGPVTVQNKEEPKPTIPTLAFPDFPEGLASKFMSAECSVIKKPEMKDSPSPIRAAKTYEKSRHGKPKIAMSEHDYTTSQKPSAPDVDEIDITSHIAMDPKVRNIISISKITPDVKKIDRRKSMETLSKRKGIYERRNSSENKRELEQRRLMILEEIKQDKKAGETSSAPPKPSTIPITPVIQAPAPSSAIPVCSAEVLDHISKTEHDLSDVIDILENIDSTPTRLLSSSELQSIEKTALFESDDLDKSPSKPKTDEKINIQSLLNESGKSDLQMSDLARGPSKPVVVETRAPQPSPNNHSKLAALLTGGKVPTLESLLEKDIEDNQKKVETPTEPKIEPNLLLSPTSGIMRSSPQIPPPSPSTQTPVQTPAERIADIQKELLSSPPPVTTMDSGKQMLGVLMSTRTATPPQSVPSVPVLTSPSMQQITSPHQMTQNTYQQVVSQAPSSVVQQSIIYHQQQQPLQQQPQPQQPQQQISFQQIPQQPIILQEQFQQHLQQQANVNQPRATFIDQQSQMIIGQSQPNQLSQPPRFQLVGNNLQRLSVPSAVMSTSIHPSRIDESQNVLLKQLLQNTGCAGGASSPGLPRSPTPSTPSPITSPTIKKEPMEVPCEIKMDSIEDVKKMKRRQYQQKRRQSQGKEVGPPKKRARKGSRMEEDYESYTESLMSQLKQMEPLAVMEPSLSLTVNVYPVFGSSELTLPAEDFYSTIPFGDEEKKPPRSPVSTQRGFYDQEFATVQLWSDADERRLESLLGPRERDTDTPDTVLSSSSPECVISESPLRFPALHIIKEDSEAEHFNRSSPSIPIVVPIPIRPKAGLASHIVPPKQLSDDKENKENVKPSNVRVTLTLNSDAARDVLSVLKDLANLLHIPPPTTYQIVERTTTPTSMKLGLYKNRGKDGKEGAPVDIQSILNGQAKFCKHCDVVILVGAIRKKVWEVPFLAKRDDLDSMEELHFCSSNCFMQFSLMHKSPNEGVECAGSVVDHIGAKTPTENTEPPSDLKPFKGNRYKLWQPGCLQPTTRYKKPTERELMDMLFRAGVTLIPSQNTDDTRRCLFCHQVGDGIPDGPARLLNFDVNKWVHLNCALWSDDVYERVNGALMNVDNALQQGQSTSCALCGQLGATLHCFKVRCSNVYHLSCAVKDECVFFKNKTTYCLAHVPKNDKDNELTTLSVYRRVYVQRDEEKQVAAVMHNSELNHLMRVGSLIFLSVGQLLPHQLPVFHTPHYIYPVGYKIIRFYWSMRRVNKRCKYVCSIQEESNRPVFNILVQEPGFDDIEVSGPTARAAWMRVLEPLQNLRRENGIVQIFPRYVSGEDLFGLTEPAVVRVLESLPGIETLTDYKFKYGRNPLLELPLAVNPSGSARSEPRQKNLVPFKRPHTQRTGTGSRANIFSPSLPGEPVCPYSKQFVHSKSSQYKKMKLEWRNNVYLARSKIQGLGLYAARDLERHTMVIEYIGEIIRHELSESREKQYEARNRGIYMFRLDEERVVDATISGGLARYINHSCNPNCVTEIVEVDRELRIIIFAKRRISRGEELAYDYKFDIEDDQHKIPCLCGAPNCRKWMN